MIAIVPALAALLGLVAYLVPSGNPKLTEIGRMTFFAGLLVLILVFAGHAVRLLPS